MKLAATKAMLILAACLLLVSPLHAQQRNALRVGVVAQPIHAQIDSTSGRGKGTRILVGAGVGAVVGGVVGGLSARNGETGTSLDGIATGASVAAGALLGALVGGIVGALMH
jgi:hypothetical protein